MTKDSTDKPAKGEEGALEFYLTAPSPCPYLPDLQEQRIFTLLETPVQGQVFPLLLQSGFRRSQNMVYRPHCATCRACTSVRMKLRDFTPSAGQRRVLRRNADLTVTHTPAVSNAEIFDLYRRYQLSRHADGEMAQMDENDLAQMIGQHTGQARLLGARTADGKLVAVMLYDDLPDGRSAVYSFFDPNMNRRSLGTWMILHMAEDTRAAGKPYLYLGYWIKNARKMAYKTHFQPLEMLDNGQWRVMPLPAAES